jgi:hypothetical protein
VLVAVDEIGRAAEQLLEGRELSQKFVFDQAGIEPPQQARAQQVRKRQKQAAVDRPEVHRQRTKRRGQRRVQADRAARAVRHDILQRGDFATPDRWAYHHHRGGIETATGDQIANGAVDALGQSVIVGAQPDPAQRSVVHSAAVRSAALAVVSPSARFSECSATK